MKRTLLLLVFALALFAVACRPGRPIGAFAYDVPTAAAHKPITLQQMQDAILKACVTHNWQAREIQPNLIEASIVVRGKHHVTVSIPYTATHYSIKYKSSVNMEYKTKKDGTTVIHPNYNNWVANLDQSIRQNIAAYEF